MASLQSDVFWSPIIISLKVAGAATVLSLIIGIALVFLMQKKFAGRSIIETIIMLPMVLPPTVVGFILLYLFGRHGLLGTLIMNLFDTTLLFSIYAAIIASTLVSIPLMYQSLKIGLENISDEIIEAAKVDGAATMTIFNKMLLPLSKNAILTGILFSFARAIGEFGATLIFAGNIPGVTQTMPTAIYVAIDSNQLHLAYLWVGLMIIFSFILMLVIQHLRKQ